MRILASVLLLIFYSFSSTAQTDINTGTLLKTGEKVPNFQFEAAPGKIAYITDYKGKIVLLNFFATWCAPCNAEFQHLQKEIWETYKDNPHFVFFAFGREHDWAEVNAFAKQKEVTFPVLPDPNRKIFSIFAKAYIPRNVLIDEKGKILYQSVGFIYQNFREMKQVLAKRLNAYNHK